MTKFNIMDYGALPDGSDSTEAIQMAMNAAAFQHDTVWVPPGVFMVDALSGVFPHTGTGLQIDGVLRAIPNDKVDSVIVNVLGVNSVVISGTGAIIGDRYSNRAPPPGRHGLCLQVLDSNNILIGGGLTLREGQADGLYIQGSGNVTVDGVNCVDNARNGMSIISASVLTVTNCTFALTHSEQPYPQAGIDIEPDLPDQALLDIGITKCTFTRNHGAGCYIAFNEAANRRRIYVVNNTFDQHYRDGSGPCIGGRNSALANFLYATCRWMPGYDWWGFTTEFTLS